MPIAHKILKTLLLVIAIVTIVMPVWPQARLAIVWAVGRCQGCSFQDAVHSHALLVNMERAGEEIGAASKVIQTDPKGFELVDTPMGRYWTVPHDRFLKFTLGEEKLEIYGHDVLSFVATGVAILVFAGATFLIEFPRSSYWNPAGALTENLTNRGAHGLSEVLYANASAVATNGRAFAGLNANSPWFNVTLGIEMLIGRFLVIIPALVIAGSLALKKRLAVTGGTLPTHGPLFAALLLGTIILVTALTFFPALSLGPITEHYLMHLGTMVR